MPDALTILRIAQELAWRTPDFFARKGPGAGDRASHMFMAQLRDRVHSSLGYDYSEQKLCVGSSFAADFYIAHEGTIIEVAFSLRNSMSEFEKDILKALMAKDAGHRVEHLVFISKPGAIKRHSSPGSRAICAWAQRNHGVAVKLHELVPAPTF